MAMFVVVSVDKLANPLPCCQQVTKQSPRLICPSPSSACGTFLQDQQRCRLRRCLVLAYCFPFKRHDFISQRPQCLGVWHFLLAFTAEAHFSACQMVAEQTIPNRLLVKSLRIFLLTLITAAPRLSTRSASASCRDKSILCCDSVVRLADDAGALLVCFDFRWPINAGSSLGKWRQPAILCDREERGAMLMT